MYGYLPCFALVPPMMRDFGRCCFRCRFLPWRLLKMLLVVPSSPWKSRDAVVSLQEGYLDFCHTAMGTYCRNIIPRKNIRCVLACHNCHQAAQLKDGQPSNSQFLKNFE